MQGQCACSTAYVDYAGTPASLLLPVQAALLAQRSGAHDSIHLARFSCQRLMAGQRRHHLLGSSLFGILFS
jgi:hypothetical protein